MKSPVGWFEIYVQDLARARAFYEAVFAVELEALQMPGMDMLLFPMDPEVPRIAGALVRADGVASGGNSTVVYFSCANCAHEQALAAASGGEVVREKFDIGEYGSVAMVRDTEGNLIGLHSND